MGWWDQSKNGDSFGKGGGVWGDSPADIIDEAITEIEAIFVRDWGRKPTYDEFMAGVNFSARVFLEKEDEEKEDE